MSGIRHAAERLSLRSDPKQRHTGPHPPRTGDDGTASDWYKSRGGSLGYPEQQGSAPTISHIPLVQVEPNAKVGREPRLAGDRVDGQILEPTENGNGRVIKGFDAV